MNISTVIVLIAVGLIGLVGLCAASHAVDAGIYVFGLVLFSLAVLLEFQLIKRHFDAAELAPDA